MIIQGAAGGGGGGVKLRPVLNAKQISTANISIHLIIDFDCIK